MHLAEMDGAETMRLLLAAQPELVTILLAFAWDDETLERARRSGARAWLAKDCDEEALFAAIRTSQTSIVRNVPLAPEQNPTH
jgi:DNA-binding NarL/FixJ family response regulator